MLGRFCPSFLAKRGRDTIATRAVPLAAKTISRLVVRNYTEYCDTRPWRRALLSYLVIPLIPPPFLRDNVRFSNRGIAQQIPRALNELGYSVDILNYDNTQWRPKRPYDLFIGHGNVNFHNLLGYFSPKPVCIYFSTGMYWDVHNRNERERFAELETRTGHRLPLDRWITESEESAIMNSHGIITLGNGHSLQYPNTAPSVVPIPNAAYPSTWTGWQHRDLESAKRHFLFYSGRGTIHKGLDILVEAFRGTPLHLHVCQEIDDGFLRLYRTLLIESKNIHLHGWIPMRSPEFYRIAKLSNWVISASCSEGSQGSVIECMAHGMAPVLTDTCTIDIEDCGLRIGTANPDTIRMVISDASQLPANECYRRAEATVRLVRQRHTPETFRDAFKAATLRIIALSDASAQ